MKVSEQTLDIMIMKSSGNSLESPAVCDLFEPLFLTEKCSTLNPKETEKKLETNQDATLNA